MTLFDANEYGEATPRRKRTPKRRDIAASDGYWHVITTTSGPLEYVHRIDPRTPGDLIAAGSVLTRCDQVGRKLHTPGAGERVHPCPECRKITGW